jgi:hypothetical protein
MPTVVLDYMRPRLERLRAYARHARKTSMIRDDKAEGCLRGSTTREHVQDNEHAHYALYRKGRIAKLGVHREGTGPKGRSAQWHGDREMPAHRQTERLIYAPQKETPGGPNPSLAARGEC